MYVNICNFVFFWLSVQGANRKTSICASSLSIVTAAPQHHSQACTLACPNFSYNKLEKQHTSGMPHVKHFNMQIIAVYVICSRE